jgi:linoleoyl-CoA desaturase
MLGHHPYTNLANADGEKRKIEGGDCLPFESDQESDPDVFSSFPLMRMHPVHEPAWFHKYQHLYAPCLFALMTLAKVFQQDIEVATSKRLYHIDAHCRYDSLINLTRFWGMKALSMVYMTILPCYFHGIGKGLFLFTLGHLTCGEVLATMFIVNHVIEFAEKGEEVIKSHKDRPFTAHGSVPMEKTRAEAKNRSKESTSNEVPFNDWAAVQCQTSVNWSPGSWFWNHFSGGLSHQIEHHLFPSICHTNYVHIHDIVEETCSEYGVPYQAETNFFVAYGKMLNHLKFMGKLKAT